MCVLFLFFQLMFPTGESWNEIQLCLFLALWKLQDTNTLCVVILEVKHRSRPVGCFCHSVALTAGLFRSAGGKGF